MADPYLEEILAELEDEVCRNEDCSRKLVQPSAWRAAPQAERAEMLADGYYPGSTIGMCREHAAAMGYAGGRKGNEALKERHRLKIARHNELRSQGVSRADIAAEFGVSLPNLNKSLNRARDRGMEVHP